MIEHSSGSTMSARAQNTQRDQPTQKLNECFICQQNLWMSFFFDALAHDQKEDAATGRLTNIGKLFAATKESKEKGIYRFYYEGLGKPLSPTPVTKAKVALEVGKTALQESEKIGLDTAKDKAKESVIDKAKEKLEGQASSGHISFKKMDAISAVLQMIANVTIEAVPGIRDNAVMASVMNTGVDARLNKAMENFSNALEEQTLKVNVINIAVFGMDRGGSIARAFVNTLIKKRAREENGKLMVETPQGKAELNIRFVGLFDCVASVYPDSMMKKVLMLLAKRLGPVADMLGPSLRDKFNLTLPAQVENVEHYVAGNEVRVTRIVDSVRDSKCAYTERLFPGNQMDVGAGIAEGERGRSIELSRVPLRLMLLKAYECGVPIYSLEQLEIADKPTYQLFQLTEQISLPDRSIPASIVTLVRSYEKMAHHGGTLDDQLLGYQKVLIAALRIQHEVKPTKQSIEAAQSAQLLEQLRQQSPGYVNEVQLALLDTWKDPRIEPEAFALFARYLHDAHNDIEEQWTPSDQTLSLFNIRLTSGVPDEMDKAEDWVNELWIKVKHSF